MCWLGNTAVAFDMIAIAASDQGLNCNGARYELSAPSTVEVLAGIDLFGETVHCSCMLEGNARTR